MHLKTGGYEKTLGLQGLIPCNPNIDAGIVHNRRLSSGETRFFCKTYTWY
jgi:hypothetical protein